MLEYSAKLSVPERRQLSAEPDVLHYMHRTLCSADNMKDDSSHLDIVETLGTLFPGVVEQCRKQSLSVNYNLTCVPRAIRRRQPARKRVVSLDSGLEKLLTYSPMQIAMTFRGPGVQVRDLLPAASTVSREMTLQSKIALSPSHLLSPIPVITSPTPHDIVHRPLLSPVYPTESNSKVDRKTGAKKTQKDTQQELHTAYDVIAAFATGSLQAGAESLYLNSSQDSPWNPYNLTVVPKTRANPDHYIISKFGILHVQPGGSSDLQSFADWLREAGLFALCQQISYFRLFLLRKMFCCWHHNVCYQQFVRIFSKVDRVGLRFFPEFHETIDNIHKLNTELLNMPTHTLTPLGAYSADALEKTSDEVRAKTHRLLQRYFKYCKRVVSEAISATRRRAELLEEEKKHQPFVSDSPISVQVAQHAELEQKLGVARYRAGRLVDFVRLAEQMMAGCLLQLARESGRRWVNETLRLSSPNEGSHSSSSLDTDDRGTSMTEESSMEGENEDQALLTIDLKTGEKGKKCTDVQSV